MAKTSNNSSTSTNGSSKKRTYLLVGLGLLATTILTFFGISYWKKHKQTQPVDTDSPDFNAENPYHPNTVKVKKKTSTQTANTHKKEQATPANEQDSTKSYISQIVSPIKNFRKTVKDSIKSKLTPAMLAKGLQMAYLNIDFTRAYKYLKYIHTVQEYITVNKFFVFSLTGRVRKTIVTGLLDTFKTENQRHLLFTEFKRIGLKQKGNQWTLGDLEGVPQQLLITARATKVWKNPRTSVPVPANMVLGREVCKRGAFKLFENKHHYFLVESTTVKKH